MEATASPWRTLLTSALRVIDSLVDAGYGRLPFRFGGGTVLMFAFDHRVSLDIDLFVDDAWALSFLSPRLNDVAAAMSADHVEQANSVKLTLAEGDIDFIVAGSVTPRRAGGTLDFDGRAITLEPIEEILAKKLMYRASSLRARDVFDLGAALDLAPAAAAIALSACRSVHPVLRARLEQLARLGAENLARDIMVTAAGAPYRTDMIARALLALREADEP